MEIAGSLPCQEQVSGGTNMEPIDSSTLYGNTRKEDRVGREVEPAIDISDEGLPEQEAFNITMELPSYRGSPDEETAGINFENDAHVTLGEILEQDNTSIVPENDNSFILDANTESQDELDGGESDCSASGMECMELFDLDTSDISLVPMELLQPASAKNSSLGTAGMGTSLNSLQFAIAGAEWDIGPVPVKCLELGAVTVASLTMGTFGMSVLPLASATTMGMDTYQTGRDTFPAGSRDCDTLSSDSMPFVMNASDSVIVDSLTPAGVRECWHPLEERLYALEDALVILDEKLESFAPRLEEANTLLNDVEYSLQQHAMHISDIMRKNSELSQRIVQLEEQVTGERKLRVMGKTSAEDC